MVNSVWVSGAGVVRVNGVRVGRQLVEAHRIAGATVLPEFIYGELTSPCFPTVPLIDPDVYDLDRRAADPPVEVDLFSGSYDLQGYLYLAIDPQIESRPLPENGFAGMYLKSANDEATIFGVTDVADITLIREYVQQQIQVMKAP